MLRKIDCIVSGVNQSNAKYLKRTHKFGIEVPNTVAEAIALDGNICDTLWQDAISKEMKNVRSEFKILAEGGKLPPGYQKILCHMIFEIRMEGFRLKARLVTGFHVTNPPATITYASVVLRETVRVALTVVALNDLQLRKSDIQNAYIQITSSLKDMDSTGDRVWARLWEFCGGFQRLVWAQERWG